MPTIQSLDDLRQIREERLQKQKDLEAARRPQVFVGMGMCGIAAGAGDTLEAILQQIEHEHLSGVKVTQTGCIGICEAEPVVQVAVGKEPRVTYGKVTPEVAQRILKEHVVGGKVLPEYVVEV